MAERKYFGKLGDVIEPPPFIEAQTDSYAEFLQSDATTTRRKNTGLQAVFKEVFPIESYDGQATLDFVEYSIGESKTNWLDCLREICATRDAGRLVLALKEIVLDYSPSAHLLKRVIETRESRRATAAAG